MNAKNGLKAGLRAVAVLSVIGASAVMAAGTQADQGVSMDQVSLVHKDTGSSGSGHGTGGSDRGNGRGNGNNGSGHGGGNGGDQTVSGGDTNTFNNGDCNDIGNCNNAIQGDNNDLGDVLNIL